MATIQIPDWALIVLSAIWCIGQLAHMRASYWRNRLEELQREEPTK